MILGLSNTNQQSGTGNRNYVLGSRRRSNWSRNPQDGRRSNGYVYVFFFLHRAIDTATQSNSNVWQMKFDFFFFPSISQKQNSNPYIWKHCVRAYKKNQYELGNLIFSHSTLSNRRRQETIPVPVENFIQDFIFNLSGAGLGHSVGQDAQPSV